MKKTILFATLIALAFAGEPKLISMDAAQAERAGVAVAAVLPAPAGVAGTFSGTAVLPPENQKVVSLLFPATVEKVFAVVHQTVKKGEPLADVTGAALVEAQLDYLERRNQREIALRRGEADRQLAAEGVISSYEAMKSGAEAERALFREAQAAELLLLYGMDSGALETLAQTKKVRSSLTLLAPRSGVVLDGELRPGQRLEPGVPVAKIAVTDPVWLEAAVPLETADRLSAGDPALLPGGVRGKVTAVASAADRATQTVTVRVEAPNPKGRFRPGGLYPVTLETRERGLFEVPASAVTKRGGESLVFLARPGGFLPVPVAVKAGLGDRLRVAGALTGGDRVAVSGVAALKGALDGLGGEEE